MDQANLSNFATPNLAEFNPHIIPYQYKTIQLVRNFDYSDGVLEILLSGSIGSAKSILMAHLACTHVLSNPRSRFLIGRKSMPDLKNTLLKKIDEHLEGVLIKGKHYEKSGYNGHYQFSNGSEFISASWHDKNFKRFLSLELSGAAIEEVTENDHEYFEALRTIRTRIGRLSHVRENFMIGATNPDSPDHPAYKYYIEGQSHHRRVVYSSTRDNPFLPKWYIDQLYDVYDAKEILRYIEGKWIEIKGQVIYHAYDDQISKISSYEVDPDLPICWTWDFNIGVGKPLSCLFFQVKNDCFYFFAEIIIERCITEEAVGEAIERGILRPGQYVYINGDATGRARSTQAKHSNYAQIAELLDQHKISYQIDVPMSNPPVRKRHKIINGLCKNSMGKTRIFITEGCKTLREGMRLAKLKKGAEYTEDDSHHFQHCTTALGYGIISQLERMEIGSRFRQIAF